MMFDNISEYLTFTATGYVATSYSQTSWQPNNNLVVDLLIMHGYFAPISMMAIASIFGKIANFLKEKSRLDFILYPSYCYIILSPFRFFTDAQSFFVSWILGTFICVVIYTVFLLFPSRK